jgi:hypothetical protein
MADTDTTPAALPVYTAEEATDEAVLKLLFKLRHRHADTFATVWSQLPEGAQTALRQAEIRADRVRFADQANGIELCTRPYPDSFADLAAADGA